MNEYPPPGSDKTVKNADRQEWGRPPLGGQRGPPTRHAPGGRSWCAALNPKGALMNILALGRAFSKPPGPLFLPRVGIRLVSGPRSRQIPCISWALALSWRPGSGRSGYRERSFSGVSSGSPPAGVSAQRLRSAGRQPPSRTTGTTSKDRRQPVPQHGDGTSEEVPSGRYPGELPSVRS